MKSGLWCHLYLRSEKYLTSQVVKNCYLRCLSFHSDCNSWIHQQCFYVGFITSHPLPDIITFGKQNKRLTALSCVKDSSSRNSSLSLPVMLSHPYYRMENRKGCYKHWQLVLLSLVSPNTVKFLIYAGEGVYNVLSRPFSWKRMKGALNCEAWDLVIINKQVSLINQNSHHVSLYRGYVEMYKFLTFFKIILYQTETEISLLSYTTTN